MRYLVTSGNDSKSIFPIDSVRAESNLLVKIGCFHGAILVKLIKSILAIFFRIECVCVCVCAHARKCECLCVSVCVCLCVCVCMCLRVCVHMGVRAHAHAHVLVCIFGVY